MEGEEIRGGEVIGDGDVSADVMEKGSLSPLTGSYLLIVLAEPHSEEDREIILQRLNKGLLSWDVDSSHVDLNCELLNLTNSNPEGDEARNGEKLVQWASENLVVEVLIHSQVNTLQQCMKNLLASFTRHRHIIHAGYTFQGSGSWVLQDGTFSLSDYLELWGEGEVQRILSAYKGDISVSMHCASENGWTQERLCKEPFAKLCQITINPDDKMSQIHNSGIGAFSEFISKMLIPSPIKEILEPSDIVGNIRFSHPTLYVFPGGQGDAALFGINGFNMLIDGGFARKACFWDFTRHLDRLDAVLLTRINNNSVGGLSSVIQRKVMSQVYPQIGHFFGNVIERKGSSEDKKDESAQKQEKLLVSLNDEGHRIVENLRNINLRPHLCFRETHIEPINLYHKVGHGKLDLYVLNPAKDSREVKEFLSKWNTDCKSFVSSRMSSRTSDGKDFQFPILNLVSICALLVWQPANPRDPITRILFPGSTPQHKIFEALGKLKHLEFLRYPVCTAKTIAASHRSQAKSEKVISEAKEQLSKVGSHSNVQNIHTSSTDGSISRTHVSKTSSASGVHRSSSHSKVASATSLKEDTTTTTARERPAKRAVSKSGEDSNKIQTKSSDSPSQVKRQIKATSKSTLGKTPSLAGSKEPPKKKEVSVPPVAKKISPTSPAKKIESKVKTLSKLGSAKDSPPQTPPKSAKDANNRRVIEHKSIKSKTESQQVKPLPRVDIKKKVPPAKSSIPTSVGSKSPTKKSIIPKKTAAGVAAAAAGATAVAVTRRGSKETKVTKKISDDQEGAEKKIQAETNGSISHTKQTQEEIQEQQEEDRTQDDQPSSLQPASLPFESGSELSSLDHISVQEETASTSDLSKEQFDSETLQPAESEQEEEEEEYLIVEKDESTDNAESERVLTKTLGSLDEPCPSIPEDKAPEFEEDETEDKIAKDEEPELEKDLAAEINKDSPQVNIQEQTLDETTDQTKPDDSEAVTAKEEIQVAESKPSETEPQPQETEDEGIKDTGIVSAEETETSLDQTQDDGDKGEKASETQEDASQIPDDSTKTDQTAKEDAAEESKEQVDVGKADEEEAEEKLQEKVEDTQEKVDENQQQENVEDDQQQKKVTDDQPEEKVEDDQRHEKADDGQQINEGEVDQEQEKAEEAQKEEALKKEDEKVEKVQVKEEEETAEMKEEEKDEVKADDIQKAEEKVAEVDTAEDKDKIETETATIAEEIEAVSQRDEEEKAEAEKEVEKESVKNVSETESAKLELKEILEPEVGRGSEEVVAALKAEDEGESASELPHEKLADTNELVERDQLGRSPASNQEEQDKLEQETVPVKEIQEDQQAKLEASSPVGEEESVEETGKPPGQESQEDEVPSKVETKSGESSLPELTEKKELSAQQLQLDSLEHSINEQVETQPQLDQYTPSTAPTDAEQDDLPSKQEPGEAQLSPQIAPDQSQVESKSQQETPEVALEAKDQTLEPEQEQPAVEETIQKQQLKQSETTPSDKTEAETKESASIKPTESVSEEVAISEELIVESEAPAEKSAEKVEVGQEDEEKIETQTGEVKDGQESAEKVDVTAEKSEVDATADALSESVEMIKESVTEKEIEESMNLAGEIAAAEKAAEEKESIPTQPSQSDKGGEIKLIEESEKSATKEGSADVVATAETQDSEDSMLADASRDEGALIVSAVEDEKESKPEAELLEGKETESAENLDEDKIAAATGDAEKDDKITDKAGKDAETAEKDDDKITDKAEKDAETAEKDDDKITEKAGKDAETAEKDDKITDEAEKDAETAKKVDDDKITDKAEKDAETAETVDDDKITDKAEKDAETAETVDDDKITDKAEKDAETAETVDDDKITDKAEKDAETAEKIKEETETTTQAEVLTEAVGTAEKEMETAEILEKDVEPTEVVDTEAKATSAKAEEKASAGAEPDASAKLETTEKISSVIETEIVTADSLTAAVPEKSETAEDLTIESSNVKEDAADDELSTAEKSDLEQSEKSEKEEAAISAEKAEIEEALKIAAEETVVSKDIPEKESQASEKDAEVDSLISAEKAETQIPSSADVKNEEVTKVEKEEIKDLPTKTSPAQEKPDVEIEEPEIISEKIKEATQAAEIQVGDKEIDQKITEEVLKDDPSQKLENIETAAEIVTAKTPEAKTPEPAEIVSKPESESKKVEETESKSEKTEEPKTLEKEEVEKSEKEPEKSAEKVETTDAVVAAEKVESTNAVVTTEEVSEIKSSVTVDESSKTLPEVKDEKELTAEKSSVVIEAAKEDTAETTQASLEITTKIEPITAIEADEKSPSEKKSDTVETSDLKIAESEETQTSEEKPELLAEAVLSDTSKEPEIQSKEEPSQRADLPSEVSKLESEESIPSKSPSPQPEPEVTEVIKSPIEKDAPVIIEATESAKDVASVPKDETISGTELKIEKEVAGQQPEEQSKTSGDSQTLSKIQSSELKQDDITVITSDKSDEKPKEVKDVPEEQVAVTETSELPQSQKSDQLPVQPPKQEEPIKSQKEITLESSEKEILEQTTEIASEKSLEKEKVVSLPDERESVPSQKDAPPEKRLDPEKEIGSESVLQQNTELVSKEEKSIESSLEPVQDILDEPIITASEGGEPLQDVTSEISSTATSQIQKDGAQAGKEQQEPSEVAKSLDLQDQDTKTTDEKSEDQKGEETEGKVEAKAPQVEEKGEEKGEKVDKAEKVEEKAEKDEEKAENVEEKMEKVMTKDVEHPPALTEDVQGVSGEEQEKEELKKVPSQPEPSDEQFNLMEGLVPSESIVKDKEASKVEAERMTQSEKSDLKVSEEKMKAEKCSDVELGEQVEKGVSLEKEEGVQEEKEKDEGQELRGGEKEKETDATKFIRPLPYDETIDSQDGLDKLLQAGQTLIDKESSKRKEEEKVVGIPSAIAKLPRESREVIRTPDEVADLPVHEEVEPGTYETDELIEEPDTEEYSEEDHGVDAIGIVNIPQSPSPHKQLEEEINTTHPSETNQVTKPITLPEIAPLPEASSDAVTKIDAAVSPVLESLLGQSPPKAFPQVTQDASHKPSETSPQATLEEATQARTSQVQIESDDKSKPTETLLATESQALTELAKLESKTEIKIESETKAEIKSESKTEAAAVIESKTATEIISESKIETAATIESKTVTEVTSESKTESAVASESKTETEVTSESKHDATFASESKTESDATTESKIEAVADTKAETTSDIKAETISETKTDTDTATKIDIGEAKKDEKSPEIPSSPVLPEKSKLGSEPEKASSDLPQLSKEQTEDIPQTSEPLDIAAKLEESSEKLEKSDHSPSSLAGEKDGETDKGESFQEGAAEARGSKGDIVIAESSAPEERDVRESDVNRESTAEKGCEVVPDTTTSPVKLSEETELGSSQKQIDSSELSLREGEREEKELSLNTKPIASVVITPSTPPVQIQDRTEFSYPQQSDSSASSQTGQAQDTEIINEQQKLVETDEKSGEKVGDGLVSSEALERKLSWNSDESSTSSQTPLTAISKDKEPQVPSEKTAEATAGDQPLIDLSPVLSSEVSKQDEPTVKSTESSPKSSIAGSRRSSKADSRRSSKAEAKEGGEKLFLLPGKDDDDKSDVDDEDIYETDEPALGAVRSGLLTAATTLSAALISQSPEDLASIPPFIPILPEDEQSIAAVGESSSIITKETQDGSKSPGSPISTTSVETIKKVETESEAQQITGSSSETHKIISSQIEDVETTHEAIYSSKVEQTSLLSSAEKVLDSFEEIVSTSLVEKASESLLKDEKISTAERVIESKVEEAKDYASEKSEDLISKTVSESKVEKVSDSVEEKSSEFKLEIGLESKSEKTSELSTSPQQEVQSLEVLSSDKASKESESEKGGETASEVEQSTLDKKEKDTIATVATQQSDLNLIDEITPSTSTALGTPEPAHTITAITETSSTVTLTSVSSSGSAVISSETLHSINTSAIPDQSDAPGIGNKASTDGVATTGSLDSTLRSIGQECKDEEKLPADNKQQSDDPSLCSELANKLVPTEGRGESSEERKASIAEDSSPLQQNDISTDIAETEKQDEEKPIVSLSEEIRTALTTTEAIDPPINPSTDISPISGVITQPTSTSSSLLPDSVEQTAESLVPDTSSLAEQDLLIEVSQTAATPERRESSEIIPGALNDDKGTSEEKILQDSMSAETELEKAQQVVSSIVEAAEEKVEEKAQQAEEIIKQVEEKLESSLIDANQKIPESASGLGGSLIDDKEMQLEELSKEKSLPDEDDEGSLEEKAEGESLEKASEKHCGRELSKTGLEHTEVQISSDKKAETKSIPSPTVPDIEKPLEISHFQITSQSSSTYATDSIPSTSKETSGPETAQASSKRSSITDEKLSGQAELLKDKSESKEKAEIQKEETEREIQEEKVEAQRLAEKAEAQQGKLEKEETGQEKVTVKTIEKGDSQLSPAKTCTDKIEEVQAQVASNVITKTTSSTVRSEIDLIEIGSTGESEIENDVKAKEGSGAELVSIISSEIKSKESAADTHTSSAQKVTQVSRDEWSVEKVAGTDGKECPEQHEDVVESKKDDGSSPVGESSSLAKSTLDSHSSMFTSKFETTSLTTVTESNIEKARQTSSQASSSQLQEQTSDVTTLKLSQVSHESQPEGGSKPDSPKQELIGKVESIIESEVTKIDISKAEAISKTDISKAEAIAKTDISKAEAIAKTDISKAEAITKTDISKAEAISKTDISKTEEISKTDTSKAESISKTDTSKTESITKTDTSKAESISKTATSKTEEISKTDIAKIEDISKSDTSKIEVISNTDTSKSDVISTTDTSKSDVFSKTDISKADTSKTDDTSKTETSKIEVTSKTDSSKTEVISKSEYVSKIDDSTVQHVSEAVASKTGDISKAEGTSVSSGASKSEVMSKTGEIAKADDTTKAGDSSKLTLSSKVDDVSKVDTKQDAKQESKSKDESSDAFSSETLAGEVSKDSQRSTLTRRFSSQEVSEKNFQSSEARRRASEIIEHSEDIPEASSMTSSSMAGAKQFVEITNEKEILRTSPGGSYYGGYGYVFGSAADEEEEPQTDEESVYGEDSQSHSLSIKESQSITTTRTIPETVIRTTTITTTKILDKPEALALSHDLIDEGSYSSGDFSDSQLSTVAGVKDLEEELPESLEVSKVESKSEIISKVETPAKTVTITKIETPGKTEIISETVSETLSKIQIPPTGEIISKVEIPARTEIISGSSGVIQIISRTGPSGKTETITKEIKDMPSSETISETLSKMEFPGKSEMMKQFESLTKMEMPGSSEILSKFEIPGTSEILTKFEVPGASEMLSKFEIPGKSELLSRFDIPGLSDVGKTEVEKTVVVKTDISDKTELGTKEKLETGKVEERVTSKSQDSDNGNVVIGNIVERVTTTTTTTTTTKRTTGSKDEDKVGTSSFSSEFEFASTSAPSSSSRQKEAEDEDIVKAWGKPLGLPPVQSDEAAPHSNEPESSSSLAKGTPKKDKSVDRKNPGTPAKTGHSSSSRGRTHHRSSKNCNPIYVDLAYVPHHGNSNYCDSEFFRLIRARYYVFSGLEPSRQVFDGLLQGKQAWDDKNLEVTIIPTYDTDTLGYWVVDSEDALAEARIDLAPSASRCTINLQDHETSCSAYRLEF